MGLLAQLGWCRELVCVSVHKALPGHRALARRRQDVMPEVAREVQVQPPVPTKPLLGWPSLDPVPFPSPGQEKATTRYKHLLLAPCPRPLCCKSWAQRAGQPQKAEQPAQLQPSQLTGLAGGRSAGSRDRGSWRSCCLKQEPWLGHWEPWELCVRTVHLARQASSS